MGDMTFTNASGSQTVTGDGILGNMGWCGGQPPFTLTAPAFSATSVSISSAPSSNPASCPGQLTDDMYTVTHHKGFMGQNALPRNINCGPGPTKTLGSFTVTGGGGVGTGGPYGYAAAKKSVGWDNICVWGTTPGNSHSNDINIATV